MYMAYSIFERGDFAGDDGLCTFKGRCTNHRAAANESDRLHPGDHLVFRDARKGAKLDSPLKSRPAEPSGDSIQ
jgi:hypothetical protein